MKQKIFAMCAVAVLLLGLTGCTAVDNPSTPDTSAPDQSLVGLWTLPGGCTFKPIPEDTYNDWNSNTYTAEQWAAMEAAGAVFLPCAGQRNGTLTELVNVYPFYWLGSKLSANEAYGLSYTNRLAIPIAPFSAGLSVRLVKDAE